MQKIKYWVKNHRKTTIGTAIVLVLVIGMGIINKIKQNKAAQSSRYVVAKVAKNDAFDADWDRCRPTAAGFESAIRQGAVDRGCQRTKGQ